jgi:hypothetical protein
MPHRRTARPIAALVALFLLLGLIPNAHSAADEPTPSAGVMAAAASVDSGLLNQLRDAALGASFRIDPPSPIIPDNWRKIRQTTVDGVKYVFLVYIGTYSGTGSFKKQIQFGPNTDYNVSDLRADMTRLYENSDFPTINAMAVQSSLGDHSSLTAISEPTTRRAADSNGQDVYFALSRKDVVDWNSNYSNPPSTVKPGDERPPKYTWKRDFEDYPQSDGMPVSMLLRTASVGYNGNTNYVTGISARGHSMNYGVVTMAGAYQVYNASPGVWVSTAPPTPATHTVEFKLVDQSGQPVSGAAPATATVNHGGSYALAANQFPTVPGYTYVHWRDGNGAAQQGSVNLSNVVADKTVYLVYARSAQVPQVTVTVKYLMEGDESTTVQADQTYQIPQNSQVNWVVGGVQVPNSLPGPTGGYVQYANRWKDPASGIYQDAREAVRLSIGTTDKTIYLLYKTTATANATITVRYLQKDSSNPPLRSDDKFSRSMYGQFYMCAPGSTVYDDPLCKSGAELPLMIGSLKLDSWEANGGSRPQPVRPIGNANFISVNVSTVLKDNGTITLYYVPTQTSVTVKYVDTGGVPLLADRVLPVDFNSTLNLTSEQHPATIGDYQFKHWTDGETGAPQTTTPVSLPVDTTPRTLNLVYQQVHTITVRYVDADGKPLGDPSTVNYPVDAGDAFTLAPAQIPSFSGYGYLRWRDPQGDSHNALSEPVSLDSVSANGTIELVYGLAGPVAVSSTVDSYRAQDKSRDFSYTIFFLDGLNNPLPAGTTFAYTGGSSEPTVAAPPAGQLVLDDDGKATFTLRHGQSIDISQIMPDTRFRVVENENPIFTTKLTLIDQDSADPSGYPGGLDSGYLMMGSHGMGWILSYVNRHAIPVPSGVDPATEGQSFLAVAALLLAALAIGGVAWGWRRGRRM